MTLKVSHHLGDAVDVSAGVVHLLRYTYQPDDPPREAPKPYLHPVRTLAGNLVTAYRPHDHVWHKGIAVTCAHLGAHNFWGGPTFSADRGYVYLDNCGRMRHDGWDRFDAGDSSVELAHRLTWVAADGEELIAEQRTLRVGEVDDAAGSYALDVAYGLRNIGTEALSFGSPTTHGRPDAGYGGLFWRGPRSFQGGRVLSSTGAEGDSAVMGTAAEWLSFTGRHDEVDASSTLLFIDDPANPRHPTPWFVRAEPIPAASFAFMFHEELALDPGAALALRHRIVVADGAWDRDRIDDYVAAFRGRPDTEPAAGAAAGQPHPPD